MIIDINYDKKSRYATRGKMIGLELVKLPLIVDKVFSRGKLIIMQCDKIYIVIHLGMTASFTYNQKEKHSNLWFDFGRESIKKGFYEHTSTVYYTDPRKFGSVSVYNDLSSLFKKNGSCLLTASLLKYNKDFAKLSEHQFAATRKIWHNCLTNKRISNKPICEFLMEQKYVSGIGNYLRAEILYAAKISPFRKLCDLNEEERDLLYDKTLKTIYLSWRSKGPSKGYIKDGCFNLKVYMQDYDPFGNEVLTVSDNKNRTIHYVPKIQI